MKNFIITGALGFIASNFLNYLSSKYPHSHLIVLDKNDYCSSIENINKQSLHNVEIIIGDIANKELVTYILNKFNIDTVFHFAAQTHVDNSFYNSIDFTLNNVLGTHILLETCRVYHETNKLEKFIHVSTDEVYGQVIDNEIRIETSVLDPTNPYAASKAAAEFFVKSYYYSYKLPIIITRCNNVYGINQYPEKIIPKFICKLLNNEKLPIHGNGSNLRNYIHIDDVITAFETILLKGEIGQIYNISNNNNNNELSVIELAKMLINIFYPNVNVNDDEQLNNYIIYVDDRKFNDCRYFISSEKLNKLGWYATKTDIENNIKLLIKWYKENKNRYNKLK